MGLSRKEARELVCMAVASELRGFTGSDLLARRLAGDPVRYSELGLDQEGKTVLRYPFHRAFRRLRSDSGKPIRWGISEVMALDSIEATEDRAIAKSRA